MMAKEQCCGTCGYAKWKRNKRGYRMMKDYAGDCLCPIPELPDSAFSVMQRDKTIPKRHITVDDGEKCPMWTVDGGYTVSV